MDVVSRYKLMRNVLISPVVDYVGAPSACSSLYNKKQRAITTTNRSFWNYSMGS